jgi:uncharacterized protein (TIGR00369 family)
MMGTARHEESWPFRDASSSDRQARLRLLIHSLPVFQHLGVRVEKLDQDYAKLSIAFRPELAGPRGTLHGGLLSTLVDTAAACAINTALKDDSDQVTVSLDTKFFHPVARGMIFAEAIVARKGRTLAHIDVTVTDESGEVVARGWCVFAVVRRRPDNGTPQE